MPIFLPNWCFDWRGAGEIKRVILCFSSSPIDTWIFSLWLGVRWKKSLIVRQNYLEGGMPDDVFHQTFSHRYRISRPNSFEFCYHISGPNMAVKTKQTSILTNVMSFHIRSICKATIIRFANQRAIWVTLKKTDQCHHFLIRKGEKKKRWKRENSLMRECYLNQEYVEIIHHFKYSTNHQASP